jgi:hypothetical protein
MQLKGLGKLKKKFNDLVRIRTRDLPAYSIVSQPITLPDASTNFDKSRTIHIISKLKIRKIKN